MTLLLLLVPKAVWDPAWLAALGAIISAAGGAIGAIAGSLHRERKNDEKLKRITRQVENNHGDRNLRDDVDKVIDGQKIVESQLNHVQGTVEEKLTLLHDAVKSVGHQLGETRKADAIIHDDYAARLRRLEQNTDKQ